MNRVLVRVSHLVRRSMLGLALLAGAHLVRPPAAQATEVGAGRNFGLGLGLGTATSLVGKYFVSRDNALDFGLAFWRLRNGCVRDNRGVVVYCDNYGDAYRRGGFGLNVDYLWLDNIVHHRAKLDWHIGVGGRFWHWDDDYYYQDRHSALAVRMPIGLDLTFTRPSFLEVYLEAVPSLYVVPEVDFDVEAFIGVRFYF